MKSTRETVLGKIGCGGRIQTHGLRVMRGPPVTIAPSALFFL